MPARRRHRHRSLHRFLAAHFREIQLIRLQRRLVFRPIQFIRLDRKLFIEKRNHLRKRRERIDVDFFDDGRLRRVLLRKDHAGKSFLPRQHC